MDILAYLYNHSMDINGGKQEAVMAIKERPWQGLYADGVATLDFERGKASHIMSSPWQTDDSIGPWGYKKGATYMTTNMVIDKLVDIVSKNGNLLLNVPIKADGTLDEKTTQVLKGMGAWLDINGEAIYGTRPWYMFGEGPTNEIDHRAQKSPYTKRDIRFTTKDDDLYAIVLDWPGKGREITIQNITLMNSRIAPVKSLKMLGSNEIIKWEQSPDGLKIITPQVKPCENAYVFKIQFE